MKLLIFIIAMLFVGMGLSLLALENPGYVMLARPPWSVEMPLTLFGLFALLAMLASYAVIYLSVRVWRIPREVARWRQLRAYRRTEEALAQGMMNLLEGQWVKAEKRLLGELRHNRNPLINFIAAAAAAQAQGDLDKRNEYLTRAQAHAQNHRQALAMSQAHLHYAAREYEQALVVLTELRTIEPNHLHALWLLAKTYEALKDWTNLVHLMPELRRRKLMTPAELDKLELQAQRELLTLSLPSGSREVLQKAWHWVPASLRQDPGLIEIYARQLIKQNDMATALTLLTEALNRKWDERLVYWYGRVRAADPAAQLAGAEVWLDSHRNNPTLLLTLGRIAQEAKLRAKAREYLEQCAALREWPEAYHELARVLEQAGQTELAQEWYRRGLQAAVGEGRAAPAPEYKRGGHNHIATYELKR